MAEIFRAGVLQIPLYVIDIDYEPHEEVIDVRQGKPITSMKLQASLNKLCEAYHHYKCICK